MLVRNFTTCEIPLENGGFAFADTADASFLSKFKWFSIIDASAYRIDLERSISACQTSLAELMAELAGIG